MRPGFESPWGRHFLRVYQKRIVRRCKRKKFQGFENFGRFYGGNHKFGIAISGGVSLSFLMTYGRCEGSKSFGSIGCDFSDDEGLSAFKPV
jgi:hypothetical protein